MIIGVAAAAAAAAVVVVAVVFVVAHKIRIYRKLLISLLYDRTRTIFKME